MLEFVLMKVFEIKHIWNASQPVLLELEFNGMGSPKI